MILLARPHDNHSCCGNTDNSDDSLGMRSLLQLGFEDSPMAEPMPAPVPCSVCEEVFTELFILPCKFDLVSALKMARH